MRFYCLKKQSRNSYGIFLFFLAATKYFSFLCSPLIKIKPNRLCQKFVSWPESMQCQEIMFPFHTAKLSVVSIRIFSPKDSLSLKKTRGSQFVYLLQRWKQSIRLEFRLHWSAWKLKANFSIPNILFSWNVILRRMAFSFFIASNE